jgi:hypothetical protein
VDAVVSEPIFDETMSARRAAENDSRFRRANENIRTVAARAQMERIPVICECADLRCNRLLLIAPDEYERVRRSGRRFIVARQHQDEAGEWVRVVEEHAGYAVVEKVSEAATIAEELNPRAADND